MLSATYVALSGWVQDVFASASPRTRETYSHALSKLYAFLDSASLPTELEAIRPQHVRAFYASLDSMSKNSVAHFDRVLRAIFNRIEKQGREDFGLSTGWQSPWHSVDRQKTRDVPKQPLAPEQIESLLASMPRRGYVNIRNYAMVATLALTGIRVSELIGIRLSDLNLAKRALVIRGKGEKTRIVFLPSKLSRILQAFLAKRGDRGLLLFPTNEGAQQQRRVVHQMVQTAGKRIGELRLHPHLLRHTYASVALNVRNAPLKFVQEQLGHEDIATTMRYNHTFPEQGSKLADEFSVLK